MDVLLTNDDGFNAPGICALFKALKARGVAVKICAPARNKSACSHAISLQLPLRFAQYGEEIFALDDGTPADCVNLAITRFGAPKLVVSGINAGCNLAEDISYSGTASAAMEAALCGVSAVAFSEFYRHSCSDFARSSLLAAEFVCALLDGRLQLASRQFLNVNYPDAAQPWRGYKACKMGTMLYQFGAERRQDPRGDEYFWLSNRFDIDAVPAHEDDIAMIQQGFASVTPCKIDFTAYEQLGAVAEFLENLKA